MINHILNELEKCGYSSEWLKNEFSEKTLVRILKIEQEYQESVDALRAEFDDPENGHKYGRGEDYDLCLWDIYEDYQRQLAYIAERLTD